MRELERTGIMNVGSLNGTAPILGTQNSPQGAAGAVDTDGDHDRTSGPAVTGGPSKMGGVLQQLKTLAESDPTKFKEVVSHMSQTLRADAQKEGGAAADVLSKFADKLEQAAQSGDLSQFAPPEPPTSGPPQGAAAYAQVQRHHGHHGGYAQVHMDIDRALTSALSGTTVGTQGA